MVFIAIEGAKHVGKTAVAAELGARHPEWVITREPTEAFDPGLETTERGASLAQHLLADRHAHVATVIAPAIADGSTVLSTRYIMSGLVFQSLDGVPMSDVWASHDGLPLPDLSVVLLSDAPTIHERAVARGKLTRIAYEHDRATEQCAYVDAAPFFIEAGSAVHFINSGRGRTIEIVADEVEVIIGRSGSA